MSKIKKQNNYYIDGNVTYLDLIHPDKTISQVKIDTDDLERTINFGLWSPRVNNSTKSVSVKCRIRLSDNTRKHISLASFLLNDFNRKITFINQNRLDCRKSNLFLGNFNNVSGKDLIVTNDNECIISSVSGHYVATIDKQDLNLACKFKWHFNKRYGAISKTTDGKQIYLSHLILELDNNTNAIFLDGNKSNCKRNNLKKYDSKQHYKCKQRIFNNFVIINNEVHIDILFKGEQHICIIDKDDLEKVSSLGKWSGHPYPKNKFNNNKVSFVGGTTLVGKQIKLHRFILDAPNGVMVDHIDGNTLNNKKENLRLTHATGNAQNRHITHSKSGDSNVFFCKHWSKRQWLVLLRRKYKIIHWSRHENVLEAIETAKIARSMYYPTSKEGTNIKFNLAGFIPNSTVNGPGNRCVVWIGGCDRGCKMCFNPELWSFKPRNLVIPELLAKRILNSGCNGITLSGGDPLDSPVECYRLLKALHNEHNELHPQLTKGIILFSGLTIEELNPIQKECVKLSDLFIDGRYVHELRYTSGLAGSENQRFHFSSLIGRGESRIKREEIFIDQSVEVHIDSIDTIQVTGFPVINKKFLKEHGLNIEKE